jgi:STE24 endopeptidase
VLFDTLIEKHPVSELIGVLAHEVGHFKKGHVPKMTIFSFAISLGAFYVLNAVIHSETLFTSFGIAYSGPGALEWGFAFWITSLLLSPLGRAVSILTHWISRVHEFEADRFSAETTGDPSALIAALKRLSGENLGHLTPHPFKVFLDYTHPPVYERIQRLKR